MLVAHDCWDRRKRHWLAEALTADGSKLRSAGMTGAIDHRRWHPGHPHKTIVEFRGDSSIDFTGNRLVGRLGRCLQEYLLDLRGTAAQGIAQIRPQIMLQTEKDTCPDENEYAAQQERVPGTQPKGE